MYNTLYIFCTTCKNMAIFRFFKMAAAAILDLASLLKTLNGDKMSPGRFSLYMY